jgi:sugar phosphate isomerase/epimerase
LTIVAGSAALSYARTLKVVGVQLYTVRNVLQQKPEETLRALDQIGYREAEFAGAKLEAIWPILKQTSLKLVSIHLETAMFTTAQDKLPAALYDAKSKGCEYAVCPYIAPKDRGGADVMRKLGDNLNKAGEMCRKSGLHLCYHNHAFEWEKVGDERLIDVLMKSTDPALVSLELDIMWARVGGFDPAKVVEQFGKRIALMHLKNVAEGTPTQYNEKVPKTAFKEVGAGMIDIPSVLEAAAKAGVKHYFVEQDQTPGDPVDSLRQSYQYLAKLNF